MSEHAQLCSLSSPEHHDQSDVVVPITKALDKHQQHQTCGYCGKSGFQTAALLQHHADQSCALAKRFRRDEEAVSSNQEQSQDEQPSSVAIQGRLRRQSDAQALKNGARVKKKPIAPFRPTTRLPVIPNTRPAVAAVRSRAKVQQTTALVAISGTAMARIHELSQQQQQQPTATPAFRCISHGSSSSLSNQRAAARATAAAGRPSISIRPQRLGR